MLQLCTLMIMLLSGRCVADVMYLNDNVTVSCVAFLMYLDGNVTVRWVCCICYVP